MLTACGISSSDRTALIISHATTALPTSAQTPFHTHSPSPKNTFTSVPTFTSTPIELIDPSASPDPTEISTCGIPDSIWESIQGHVLFETPIIIFIVVRCEIVTMEMWAYPASGALDWFLEKNLSIPIDNDQWSYSRESGDGKLTILVNFENSAFSSGLLSYTRGYFVVGHTHLDEDVRIPWRAASGEP